MVNNIRICEYNLQGLGKCVRNIVIFVTGYVKNISRLLFPLNGNIPI